MFVDAENIAREIVEASMAWHYKRYGKPADLADAKAGARSVRLGLCVGKEPTPTLEFSHRKREKACTMIRNVVFVLSLLSAASLCRADIADLLVEFELLTKAEQEQGLAIEKHLNEMGMRGLESEDIRFAFSGNGARFLRGAIIDAAKKWDGGPRIAPLDRVLGLTAEAKVKYYFRYDAMECAHMMNAAVKIFDFKHEIPDEIKPTIKQYQPLMLMMKMRAAGERPKDPKVLDGWDYEAKARRAALAREKSERFSMLVDRVTEKQKDLEGLRKRIATIDKTKSTSSASKKRLAEACAKLVSQVEKLEGEIVAAQKEVDGEQEASE